MKKEKILLLSIFILIGMSLGSKGAIAQSSSEARLNYPHEKKQSISLSLLNNDLLGIRYAYELTPHWSIGTGIGFIKNIDIPIYARYYFMTEQHRPFLSLSNYFTLPPFGSTLAVGGGYEYKQMDGLLLRAGLEASITRNPRLIPLISVGWAY